MNLEKAAKVDLRKVVDLFAEGKGLTYTPDVV